MANSDLLGARGQRRDGDQRPGGERLPQGVLRSSAVNQMQGGERIAVLETKVDRIQTDLSDFAHSTVEARDRQSALLKKRIDEVEAKLDTILTAFEQAKGAKWALIVMAGIASTISGYVMAKWNILSQLFR